MVRESDDEHAGDNLEKSIELTSDKVEKSLDVLEKGSVPPSSLLIDSPGQSEEQCEGQGTPSDMRRQSSTVVVCECTQPLTNNLTRCEVFMRNYVEMIFDPESKLCPLGDIKDEFNKLCQTSCGRKQFACCVTTKRANGMVVCEKVFYRLVANFMTILHLCNIADDIGSAKVLMILTFTFQCEGTFLYQELLYHPIWKSIRFWNAAFFHAVHTERKMRVRSNNTFSKQTDAEKEESHEVHRNIYFGQLSSFLSNMQAFGISNIEICEFRDKLFEIGDLEQEQMEMLCTLTETKSSPPISPMDHVRKFSKTFMRHVESLTDSL